MTYKKLWELRFVKKIPTCELEKLYPQDVKKISEIALLDLSNSILEELIQKKKEFDLLLKLKKRFNPIP